jgi:hypothetical protein
VQAIERALLAEELVRYDVTAHIEVDGNLSDRRRRSDHQPQLVPATRAWAQKHLPVGNASGGHRGLLDAAGGSPGRFRGGAGAAWTKRDAV